MIDFSQYITQKIVTLNELDIICDRIKKEGKRIVFTNGCFDLLHVGHIRSLIDAKKQGDVLIVSVNDDISVRTLKGPLRPIFPDFERAEMLAAFVCVDYVTVFSGVTVTELLLRFKPDIHAKGTDYTTETVPERDAVLSYGGTIAITGDPKDHSSSDILNSLKNNPGEKTE